MRAIEYFEIESGELSINVSVICFECFDGFSDMWEGTDKHQGGVTVANPEADRNSWNYFIPKHYALADLAADYAKQGRENPSAEAYRSTQEQLMRDLHACNYGFSVSAFVGGVELLVDEYAGCWFDYSCDDEVDLLDYASRVWDEYGTTEEVIGMAKKAAREIVKAAPVLSSFAN
jgi:hypothetical protein